MNRNHPAITIVTGLPRSGTSLMMQMLAAGGLPPFTDGARPADESNPRGYFECERVKQLKTDHAWLAEARGHALKVVHLLVPALPTTAGHHYRVLFLHRDLEEVVSSQRAMLTRTGRTGATLSDSHLVSVFAAQLVQTRA